MQLLSKGTDLFHKGLLYKGMNIFMGFARRESVPGHLSFYLGKGIDDVLATLAGQSEVRSS